MQWRLGQKLLKLGLVVIIEWGTSPLAVQLLIVTDVALYRTHYDVERSGKLEVLGRPSIVQPGVMLGAAWL